MNFFKKSFIYFFLLMLIAGCTASEKDVLSETKIVAEEEFNTVSTLPNTDGENFSYYLPSEFETVSETENNIILQKENRDYILFINQLENSSSNVLYEGSIDGDEIVTYSFSETLGEVSRLGFVIVTPLEEDSYELIVGVGGMKMTTETSRKEMIGNTKIMMQIINSIEHK